MERMVRAILSASLKAGTTTAIFFPRTKPQSRPDQNTRVNDKLSSHGPRRLRRGPPPGQQDRWTRHRARRCSPTPLDSGPRPPILPAVMAETKSESKAPKAKAKAPAAKAANKAAADAAPPAR